MTTQQMRSGGVSGKTETSAPGTAGSVFLVLAGFTGLLASMVLTLERIKLLIDSSFVPSCSLNPVLSCGTVMTTPQAAVFGFPNPVIGIPAFTVVLVTGVLTLGGTVLPRWYWVGLSSGLVLGLVFVHWLIFQSIYRIGALCPYCMAVWIVVLPLTVVAMGTSTRSAHRPTEGILFRWRWSFVVLWFVSLSIVVLEAFWDYWSTLL